MKIKNFINGVWVLAIIAISPMVCALTAEPWTLDEIAIDTETGGSDIQDLYNLLGQLTPTEVNNMLMSYESTIDQGAFVDIGGGVMQASFTETGIFRISQYQEGYISEGGANGSDVQTALGAGIYALWGEFELTGTATITGPDQLTVEVLTGSINFYIDLDPSDPLDKDLMVASADTILSGGAVLTRVGQTNDASGSFEVLWSDLELTTFGHTYWPYPVNFHMIIDANADVDGLQGVFDPEGTNFDTAGQGNIYLSNTVPEPSSVALIGIGLLGLGFMRRKAST